MMVDNNSSDDFDDFDSGDGFDDFDSGDTLGGAIQNNPLVKIGLVVVVLAVVIGGIFVFSGGGSQEKPEDSRLASTPDINPDLANPNVDLPDVYEEVFRAASDQEANAALQRGESAVSPPIFGDEVFEDPLAIIEEQVAAPQEDPLDVYRRQLIEQEVQQERQVVQQQQQQLIQEQQQFQQEIEQVFSIQPDPASVQQLSQAMLEQMNSILGGVTIGPVSSMTVTSFEEEQVVGEDGQPVGQGFGTVSGGASAEGVEQAIEASVDIQEVYIEAGTFNYAQILNEATTDAPTPVMAVLLSGPLKGGRLIGQFNMSPTQQSMTIQFNTIVKDGVSYSANAFAVDPNTSSPAIVTEYDRRLLRRVFLPAAAEFIQGLAGAYAQQEQTEVTIGDDVVTTSTQDIDFGQELAAGVEQGADELGQFLRQEGNQFPPLVRVAPGTPIGVIYVDNVIESNPGTVAGVAQGRQTLPPGASQSPGSLPPLPEVTNNPIADGLQVR